jgi:hypothetical protein
MVLRRKILHEAQRTSAPGGQRLDQHRSLIVVERAGDPCALQRLGSPEFLAQRHQARHLGLGDFDFCGGGKIDVLTM